MNFFIDKGKDTNYSYYTVQIEGCKRSLFEYSTEYSLDKDYGININLSFELPLYFGIGFGKRSFMFSFFRKVS